MILYTVTTYNKSQTKILGITKQPGNKPQPTI